MGVLQTLTKDLPADPARALHEVATRAGKIVNSHRTTGDYRAVTAFMVQFDERFALKLNLSHYAQAAQGSDASVMLEVCSVALHQLENKQIGTDVDEVISLYESLQSDETFGLARLNAEEKQKIHDLIKRARAIIEKSDLSDRKKNALFERLNELAREVDAHGTKTDRFFAFAGDMAFVLGEMATKAKPLLEEVREILKIVSRSRARQEGISLPKGDEPLQLPAPDDKTTSA